jgi:hypothetical protein
MILKALEPGDIFIHARSRTKHAKKYVAVGLPRKNKKRLCFERLCKHVGGESLFKSCDLEIKKVGESMRKAEMLKKQQHG